MAEEGSDNDWMSLHLHLAPPLPPPLLLQLLLLLPRPCLPLVPPLLLSHLSPCPPPRPHILALPPQALHYWNYKRVWHLSRRRINCCDKRWKIAHRNCCCLG